MTRTALDGLALWKVGTEEVSAGWFRVRAVRSSGNLFEKLGPNPEEIVEELRSFEREMQQSLKVKASS